ncbi:LLM class flavin-dependent oxidoreductase [Bradyrhizobium sp. dw_78]|uniref:LLM class flavin-dependent oxidoreductase n=1 Tax=Bradyrhizobium sp. dw_78 TaxID=2719793 RepID=UPI001BD3D69B|nr:LLM class flavin-dependent oxidoreductase [Bradyrhizobium sp. dw_78]
MVEKRQIKLGLSMQGYGYHHSGWLDPAAPVGGAVDFRHYLDMTRTAEAGLFDMVFLADFVAFPMVDLPKGALGRRDRDSLEPLSLLSALAPQTQNVGLVATMSTTFAEPYHTARAYASIDHISGGRVGWNVVTSFQDEEAKNFGSSKILEKELRYERAEEFVDVVCGLWNSFEVDAFPRDKSAGVYFDPAKVRILNHVGKHFRVKGPLTVPPTPQGRPVIVQAGASAPGQELAARTADVVYAVQNTLEDAQKFYRSLKGRMARYGRAEDELKVMPGLLAVIGDTEQAARAKYKQMQEMVDPMVGLEYLARVFGDLSGYPLDGPVPDLRQDTQLASRSEVLLNVARRNNYSIRQLFQSVAIGNAHNTLVGTPEQIVDTMEAWFLGGGADGFNILPAVSPASLREFVQHIVPELQRRGLFRTSYEGSTLRENLGLPAPKNLAPTNIGAVAAH